MTLRNLWYEDSSESESDYSDDKYVVDDCQILRSERHHEI